MYPGHPSSRHYSPPFVSPLTTPRDISPEPWKRFARAPPPGSFTISPRPGFEPLGSGNVSPRLAEYIASNPVTRLHRAPILHDLYGMCCQIFSSASDVPLSARSHVSSDPPLSARTYTATAAPPVVDTANTTERSEELNKAQSIEREIAELQVASARVRLGCQTLDV